MILTKKVEVLIHPSNLKYYKDFFNDIKIGLKINVDVDILYKGSKIKVNVLCDNCYSKHDVEFRNVKEKYYCRKCFGVINSKKIKYEEEIIMLYKIEKMTIIDISKKLNFNRKKVSNIIKSKGIKITLKDKNYKKIVFTDEHKRKVSDNGRKCTGRKSSSTTNYKNMASHLRFDVDYLWLIQFEDFEKLKFLNRAIAGDHYKLNTQTYKEYLIRFYNDSKFEKIYRKWLKNNKNKWLIPSLDHINPKINNNLDNVNNLEFLTWFENRSKNNINPDEWKIMKENIYFYMT